MNFPEAAAVTTTKQDTYDLEKVRRLRAEDLLLGGDYVARLITSPQRTEEYATDYQVTVESVEAKRRPRMLRWLLGAPVTVTLLPVAHQSGNALDLKPENYRLPPDKFMYRPPTFWDRLADMGGSPIAVVPVASTSEAGYLLHHFPISSTPHLSPVALSAQ